jgi:hypothetical protein
MYGDFSCEKREDEMPPLRDDCEGAVANLKHFVKGNRAEPGGNDDCANEVEGLRSRALHEVSEKRSRNFILQYFAA